MNTKHFDHEGLLYIYIYTIVEGKTWDVPISILTLLLPSTLAKHSPSPNTALLLSSIVQEVWVRMREGSAAVTHNDVQAAQDLSALATTLCHPSKIFIVVLLYSLGHIVTYIYICAVVLQQCWLNFVSSR